MSKPKDLRTVDETVVNEALTRQVATRNYRKPPRVDIGAAFGKLTITGVARNTADGYYVYAAKCECGNTTEVTRRYLFARGVRSCGCLGRNQVRALNRPKGEVGMNGLYTTYKRNARKRGRPFLLSKEEFKHITSSDCFYCGVPPQQLIKTHTHHAAVQDHSQYFYNGVDRVDNEAGYYLGNCVPCCGTCNRAKGARDKTEWLAWLYRIVSYGRSKPHEND